MFKTLISGAAASGTALIAAGLLAASPAAAATGTNLLNYNIYTTSARTTVWGDGTASTATIGGTGSGSAQSVTVYGRVGSGQTSLPAGAYADTVAVTVTY